jgi:CHAD domain-containing protein
MRVAPTARVTFGGDQHMLAESEQRMTTYRTAIRRRLAVRRAADRPPAGGRKAGHGSIVAPLAATVAATLAATVVVGVGAALAKAERERRRARQERARQFALLHDEPPAEGLRRIALGQLDLVLELLGGDGDVRPQMQAVHETRKALKRLRALLRLLEDVLGEPACARESAALRDAGRRLAGARDSEVMVSTLAGLLERHPRKLGRSGSIARLHRRLVTERELAVGRTLGDRAALAEVLHELRAVRARVAAWRLPERGGLELVEPALRRIYGQGRRRHRRAERGKGDRGRALHQWRKRVKDLRYAAEMLDRRDPDAEGAYRERHGRDRRRLARERQRTTRIRRLARRADELGEVLGEEHDLALLAALLPKPGRGPFDGRGGKQARKALLKQIARRRRRLRKKALHEGEHVYRDGPKRLVRRARRLSRD